MHRRTLNLLITFTLVFVVFTIPKLSVAQQNGEQSQHEEKGNSQQEPKESPQQQATSVPDFSNLCIAVAGTSAGVGSIVVAFLAFAIQELRKMKIEVASKNPYTAIRDKSRLSVLLIVAAISTLSLMGSAIFIVFSMLSSVLSLQSVAYIGTGLFIFGIFYITIGMIAYMMLET